MSIFRHPKTQNERRRPRRFYGILLILFTLPVSADQWLGSDDYIGAWSTYNLMQNFPYAQTIAFELWRSDDGNPKGIGVLINGSQQCLGELLFDAVRDKLLFKSVDGVNCNGLTGGHFNVNRGGAALVMLTFVPDDVEDTPLVTLTNAAYYRKAKETPSILAPLVASARNSGSSVTDSIEQARDAHEVRLERLRDVLDNNFETSFPQSQLIGVWRGEFFDKLQSYPVEFVLWSVKDINKHKLGGVVHFGDGICTAALRIDDTGAQWVWKTTSSLFVNRSDSCEQIQAVGSLRLGEYGLTLAMNVGTSQRGQGKMGMLNCLRDLPHDETPHHCQMAGLFQRSSPSDALTEAIQTTAFNYDATAPADGHWEILRRNDASLAQLVEEHETGLEEDAKFNAIREANYARAEQEREQEWLDRNAQIRAEEAADKARRERIGREWAARTAGGGTVSRRVELPTLPTVSGPFSSLSGGDFLNALYHQDMEAIGTFDRYYRQRKINQRRDLMGGEHWSDPFLDAAVNSTRMADTVLAMYLFHYDAKYAACLKSDAVTFEVVTVVPDVVVENLLGVEVARFYGWTERNEFKINSRFTTAFRRVGTTKPESAMATVADFLLNKGGTDVRRELLTGSKQLMNQFACDSDEIRRLENTLYQFSSR